MGQVFYDMGLLSAPEYLERSASDLIAPYVGQTGSKTVSVLKDGLGKVLFVDEAYRLIEGQFAKEAIDELVDSLTKPQFLGKLVVVLAGYTEDMNRLLKVNPGLSSRFPEEIVFQNMTAEECLTLLQRQLRLAGIDFVLEDRQSDGYGDMIKHFNSLSCLPNWGNGRDVKTLSKAIVASAFESAESASMALTVSHKDVVAALQKMLITQLARCGTKAGREISLSNGNMASIFNLATNSLPPPPKTTSTSSAAKLAEPAPALADDNPKQELQVDVAPREQPRDTGVSDETWTQLQADIRANELAQKRSQNAILELEQQLETAVTEQEARAQEEKALQEAAPSQTIPDDDDDRENERKRRHEELRIRALKARHAKQEGEEKLRRAREEADRKRKEEAQAQKKLRDMGVCPVGFRWIKQRTGYRCAGGSHFVSNSELGA
jgi:hypothetical protein